MKTSKSGRLLLILIVTVASCFSPRLHAADVGITGTIDKVPGYPGAKLDYSVGATRTAPKTANFWIYVKNNHDFDINVVVCSMLSLKNKASMNLARYEVAKNGANEWECYPSGMSFGPPNYHQSCVRVTIPAHGIANPFDTKNVFSVDFEKGDLGSVYFDVLKDCPLKNCAQVVGPDKFLVPRAPFGHSDWVNIWAHSSGTGPSPLGPGGFTSWPSGNWVTMGNPGRYQARLVGSVLDAPVGSVVRFAFSGVPGGSYEVPPCPNCPPGTGTVVRINEPFIIPADNSAAEDEIHIQIPAAALPNIPQGAVMRFHGEVFAEPGAPIYQPGQFMYGIDTVFVNDTRPPIIVTQSVEQVYSVLRVAVTATDEGTMASGASFVWRGPNGVEQERGMNFATPAAEGNLMFFADEFADLPVGVPIIYHFNVYDTLGNEASTPATMIVLRPLLNNFNDCVLPPGASFPGAGNVGRIADDGSGSNCVVHLTDINQGSAFGVYFFANPTVSSKGDSLHMRWRSLIGRDPGVVCTTTQFGRPGADGYSMSWGADLPNPPSYGNPGEEGAGMGLIVTVDTYDNGGGEAPGLEIRWRGSRVAFDNLHPDPGMAKDFLRKGVFVDADLTVDPAGHVAFNYDGRLLTATLLDWSGIPGGGGIMFGARTGGACDNHWIDDLLIENYCPPPPGTSFPGLSNVARMADDGTGENCVVHLTDVNQSSVFGAWLIRDPVLNGAGDSLHLHWRSLIGGDDGSVCVTTQFGLPGADGYSVNWATDLPTPPSYGNPGEEGVDTGLSVTVDTFDNGGGEAPGLEIKWRGARVAFDNIHPDPGLAKDFLRKGAFVDADLTVDPAGQVAFTYDGHLLTATLANWSGIPGGRILFGARTGGACDNHWIDDLKIEGGPGSGCGGDLRVARNGANVVVTWNGGGILQGSPTLGPANWSEVPGNPTGSYLTSATGPARFFRVCCSLAALAAGTPGVSVPDPTMLLSAVPLVNRGTGPAENVILTAITLEGGTLISPAVPVNLGTLAANGSVVLNTDFTGGPFIPLSSHALTMQGTYSVGTAIYPFTLAVKLVIPPGTPGEAGLTVVTAAPNRVEGAPFPSQPLGFGPQVNPGGPPVPTGPFVPGTPTQNETGSELVPQGAAGMTAEAAAAGARPVVFLANNGLGLPSGNFNGTASTTAEPSGASGGGVIFAAANWVAAYSTDGGITFNRLDPTTVFPNDAVGFCCDQIVQYVPSINRFIWLLQGNGYRLASASPQDIINSGGRAWTYWNLTPNVFGGCAGFDYPDMSVGNNSLYLSWDAGFGGCSGGFQVVRTSLAGLQAGGTITLEFTDPALGTMAWGSHVMQNTLNEVFWAGHNNNSQMRVFSLAEGSGVYSWRDVGISTWANNAPTSLTPDGQDWLAKNFNGPGGNSFPRNGIIGATRSGSQLWFAWTAGTDNNFRQAHVEMVTLDRGSNFRLIQQVQIWNNNYAFAYPALATDACTQEVGLSLEYGGNGNYENHVVGFWGDFVVYITSASNIGTTRFGDYVTLRQAPFTDANPGNLFTAFGYGLNAVPPPGAGTTTDIRYVLFGRPASLCR